MRSDFQIELERPLQGLRMHVIKAGAPLEPQAALLFDLQAEAARKEEEQQAFMRCVAGIEAQLNSIPGTVAGQLQDVVSLATELGLALAREIVGDALDRGHLDPSETVINSLRSLVQDPNEGQVEIFVEPQDLSLVIERLGRVPELRAKIENASFTADPNLSRGSVRIETGNGRLLYDPIEALERVCEEVRKAVTA